MEKSNKKNVLVLTIIAIVTMIVVVVGATYAYLASQIVTSDTANIEATTSGSSDIVIIEAGDDLSVSVADEDSDGVYTSNNLEDFSNGGADATDATSESSPYIEYISSAGGNKGYDVTLEISSNGFTYSSGTCYSKSGEITTDALNGTYSTCTGAGNYWATSDGSTYACYATDNLSELLTSDNKTICLSSSNNIWAKSETPELVLDVYTGASGACASNAGKCVIKSNNTISSTYTNESDCTSNDGRWVESVSKNSICYTLDKTVDLTNKAENEVVTLYQNQQLVAPAGGSVTDNYYSKLIFLNQSHNQLDNLGKTFKAKYKIALTNDVAE